MTRKSQRGMIPAIEALEGRILLSTLPVVSTLPATSVSETAATLNGSVNPNGSTVAAAFQYSTNSTFTPSVQTPRGTGYSGPEGLALDKAGDVFVADNGNNAVWEILPNNTISTLPSGFFVPSGVAVDAAGDVFVADYGHNAIKEVFPNDTIKTLGSGFSQPEGVAVDKAGDVFVCDSSNNAVKEILTNGTIKTIGSGFDVPSDVAVDAAGDVFVADEFHNAVKEVLSNGTINTLGFGFSLPSSVAVDGAGDLFVADFGNRVVKEILPNGTIVALGSGFGDPYGVTVDGAGDVFVSDYVNNEVFELSPPTIAATPSAVSGSAATAVSAALTGLATDTTYYDRVVATSPVGTVADTATPPQSFTTGAPVVYTVDLNTDTGTSDGTDRGDLRYCLSQAISNPGPNGDTILFASNLAHTTISLSATTETMPTVFKNPYDQTSFIIGAGDNITLDGSGAPGLTISGQQKTRLFAVEGGGILALNNLTLSNGSASGGAGGNGLRGSRVGGGGGGGGGLGGAVLVNESTFTAEGCQSDRLGIQASGGVTISGTTLSFNGTAIGTFTGGAYTTPLVVSFNANATQAAILAVLKNITLKNLASHPGLLSPRSISFQLTDGAGNKDAVVRQTVDFRVPPSSGVQAAAAKDAVFAKLGG